MTQTEIIEDAAGTTAEVSTAAGGVELATSAADGNYFIGEDGAVTASLVLTPRQARALARQLLAQADATEYGELFFAAMAREIRA